MSTLSYLGGPGHVPHGNGTPQGPRVKRAGWTGWWLFAPDGTLVPDPDGPPPRRLQFHPPEHLPSYPPQASRNHPVPGTVDETPPKRLPACDRCRATDWYIHPRDGLQCRGCKRQQMRERRKAA